MIDFVYNVSSNIIGIKIDLSNLENLSKLQSNILSFLKKYYPRKRRFKDIFHLIRFENLTRKDKEYINELFKIIKIIFPKDFDNFNYKIIFPDKEIFLLSLQHIKITNYDKSLREIIDYLFEKFNINSITFEIKNFFGYSQSSALSVSYSPSSPYDYSLGMSNIDMLDVIIKHKDKLFSEAKLKEYKLFENFYNFYKDLPNTIYFGTGTNGYLFQNVMIVHKTNKEYLDPYMLFITPENYKDLEKNFRKIITHEYIDEYLFLSLEVNHYKDDMKSLLDKYLILKENLKFIFYNNGIIFGSLYGFDLEKLLIKDDKIDITPLNKAINILKSLKKLNTNSFYLEYRYNKIGKINLNKDIIIKKHVFKNSYSQKYFQDRILKQINDWYKYGFKINLMLC